MRLTKFLKRIAVASLAAVVAVTAIPYSSSVKAASDSYPQEVYFPIEVLDFREDSLLFEWVNTTADQDLALYQNYYGLGVGKGLVEDELGADGLPVYKREIVEKIANAVHNRLLWGSDFLNNKFENNSAYHPLSLKSLICADVYVLNWYTNRRITEDNIWVPEDHDISEYRVEMIDSADYSTYKTYDSHTGSYNEIYAEVYDDTISSTKPIYILKRDAIVFFYDVAVSKTFTGLKPDAAYTLKSFGIQTRGTVEVWANDELMSAGEPVMADAHGEIKVTIKSTSSANGDINIATDEFADARSQKYATWSIWLENQDKGYDVGDYAESKAKYDENPDLGWYDIRTCMDYAYFVTKNLFKYNSSLNTQYNTYDNLIFHKVEDAKTGKIYYEFAADTGHPADDYKLICNTVNKTIRNKMGVGANSAIGETLTLPAGSMFILDDAVKEYPDKDNKVNNHNFHFTISSHSNFVFKRGASQTFKFTGDDDVYAFVNGHLAMDLGGAHSPTTYTINLDTLYNQQEAKIAAGTMEEEDRWLIDGEVVSLDFFYMERHSTQSNFYAKLNFKLATDRADFNMPYESIPYGFLVDLNYSFNTLRELTTNKNITFTDNFGNVIGAEGFSLAPGVSLADNKLTVTVKDANDNVIDARSRVFVFADSTAPTDAEIAAVRDYFKGLEVTKGEKVEIIGPQYDTSCKAYSEYDLVEGETNTRSLDFETYVDYEAWQQGATSATKGHADDITVVRILTGSIKVSAAQEDNEKKELNDYGLFTIDRDTSDESVHSGSFHYDNNPEAVGITEVSLNELARGRYTLKLDPTVLTSYKVMINDEEVSELTLDFEPEYDSETKTWIYPEVKFELRAKRTTPDLKDLT